MKLTDNMSSAAGAASHLYPLRRGRAEHEQRPSPDFTIADFEELGFKSRLRVLAKAINEPLRASAHLSMVPGKSYPNGVEILKDVFAFFDADPRWVEADPKETGRYLPTDDKTYISYVHETGPGAGLMTTLGITAPSMPDETDYLLTSFGVASRGFVARSLMGFIETGVDPRDFFGTASRRAKTDPQDNSVKFLLFMYKNRARSASAVELAVELYGNPRRFVTSFLARYEAQGLVTYESVNEAIGERKMYKFNKRWARRLASDDAALDGAVHGQHHVKPDAAAKVVRGIARSHAKAMTADQLLSFAPDSSRDGVLRAMAALKMIHLSCTRSDIRLTPKGAKLIEAVVLPMVDVAHDPRRLKAMRYEELTRPDRMALLNIYRLKKERVGRTKAQVLKSLPKEGTGITAEECALRTHRNRSTIHRVLTDLRKEGRVVNVPGCRWLKVMPKPRDTAPLMSVHRSASRLPTAAPTKRALVVA